MIKEKLLNSFVKVESIHLFARRWLDFSCGITYHTCEIWENGVKGLPFASTKKV
jgi:hypothetical protein